MDAPKSYKDAGMFNLIAGLLNVITAGVFVLALFWMCVGFLWLIPLGAGIYQTWLGFQMQSGTHTPGARNVGLIGLIASVLNFNVIAVALSFIAMKKAGDPEVTGYLAGS